MISVLLLVSFAFILKMIRVANTGKREKFLSLNLIQMFLFYLVYPPSPNHQHTHFEKKEILFTSTLLVSCHSPRQLWYTGLKNDNNKNHSTFCPVFAVLDVCELCVEQFTNAIEAGVPGTSLLPQPPCPFTSHLRPHPVPPHCWHWLWCLWVWWSDRWRPPRSRQKHGWRQWPLPQRSIPGFDPWSQRGWLPGLQHAPSCPKVRHPTPWHN